MPLVAPPFRAFEPPPACPAGGSPRTDDALMDWVRGTIDEFNAWARFEVCREWQLLNHLFKTLGGREALGRVPNWNHKIRWLGIEYARLPELFEAEARAYLLRLYHKGG